MQSSGGNNQMRQLQTEIERLKTDLRNFKIAINDIKITNKNVVQDVSGINRLIQNIRTRISSHGYVNVSLNEGTFFVIVKRINQASYCDQTRYSTENFQAVRSKREASFVG